MKNSRRYPIWNFVSPKKLFLVDSLGALLTAMMLGVVLVRFESVFGMPKQVLYPLSLIGCLFSIYSLACFLRFPHNWRPYLKAIAMANLAYCGLSMALVVYYFQKLSVLGLSYFLLEIVVVVLLAVIELKTAQR
jgi:hypothetical protein